MGRGPALSNTWIPASAGMTTERKVMQIGLVGLGRMGMNMGRRWLQGGHEVIAFNRSFDKTQELANEGAVATKSLQELIGKLKAPRLVWLMLPTGTVTNQHVDECVNL